MACHVMAKLGVRMEKQAISFVLKAFACTSQSVSQSVSRPGDSSGSMRTF